MSVLIAIALKSLLIGGLTLGLLHLLRKRSAAERSWVAHIGLFALVVIAFAPLVLPKWTVEAPSIAGQVNAPELSQPAKNPEFQSATKSNVPAVLPSVTEPKPAQTVPTRSINTVAAITAAYAVPAAILLLITFIALARLVALQARAEVLVDGHWLSALARAQRRMGFKHGTALLTSNELASPISWGLVRPVIVLNSRAVEATAEAEAIIAHELAHVARLDWVKLLLARVATALFWFNPLVWMLAREAHQLREETADDSVLAADIADTDYAQLLVGVARHECPGLLLGAHGVAPSKSSLARRVARVLDGKIMRGPVAGSFAAGVFVGALVIAAPLAALTLVPHGTVAANKSAAALAKKGSYAPYYQESPPSDLPSIISEGVSTSVQSAVAAIHPTVNMGDDFEAIAPNGASVTSNNGVTVARAPNGATVTTSNGITVARAPNGATTTVYPPDASGRRRVVMRSQTGAVVTYADASDVPGLLHEKQHDDRKDSVLETAISMKAVGVTPEWLSSVKAAAPLLNKADMDDLVGMKAVGVTADYIRSLAAVGFGNLDVDQLTEARAVGVNADYIRSMRSAGLGGSLDELVEMRAVGVTPAYADQFRRAGYKLSTKKLIDLRANGIDIDELKRVPSNSRDGDDPNDE